MTITLDVIVTNDQAGVIIEVVHQPSPYSEFGYRVQTMIEHELLHYYRGNPKEAVAAAAGDLCKQMLLRIAAEKRGDKP